MVLPPFALEPNAVRGLKGEWVIYATVRNPNGYDTYDCSADGAINSAAADADATAGVGATAGVSAGAAADTDDGPMARSTYMVYCTEVPYGPWTGPMLVLQVRRHVGIDI